PWGGKQRDDKIGHQLNGQNEGGGQGAPRLIKDQKGQGEAARNTSHGPQGGGQGDQGKVFRPKGLSHVFHLTFMVAQGIRVEKGPSFGKMFSQGRALLGYKSTLMGKFRRSS